MRPKIVLKILLMINDLKNIEKLFLGITQSQISNLIEDDESKEYFGYNFEVDKLNFKFRKAKITPKKIGLFVTLWRRNSKNETEPFKASDNFNFYIVATEENENYGLFIFPKNELVKRQILSTTLKDGKRGFRVYPNWSKTKNKQAEKTQLWQTRYFVDFSNDNKVNTERIKEIITNI